MFVSKRIIPCMDFFNGRIVKGTNFKNLVDIGDPLSVASFYNDQGADELVFLDISATIEKRSQLLFYINKISSKIFIPLSVGGGIRNIKNVRDLFNSGADKVSLNSSIINDSNLIKKIKFKYGSQCLIAAIDVKKIFFNNNFSYWGVYKNSGKNFVNLNVFDLILKFSDLGIGEFLITSIDLDGTKKGFDFNLFQKLSMLSDIPIICSGGLGNFFDLVNIFKIKNIDAFLAASIFHNKKYNVFKLKNFLFNNGIKVRF